MTWGREASALRAAAATLRDSADAAERSADALAAEMRRALREGAGLGAVGALEVERDAARVRACSLRAELARAERALPDAERRDAQAREVERLTRRAD